MTIRYTARALNDLDDIYDFIARDSTAFAKKTIGELTGVARALAQFPNSGRLFLRPDGVEYRMRFHRYYRIAYHILGDQIEILTIQHVAREYVE